jgi:hypothetical protein
MKIAVVTLTIGDEYTKAIDLGLKSKKEYCDAHGYDYIAGGMLTNRPPSWEKIPLVLAVLHKYDWVFFTDGDTMIMNHNIKLESFIEKYEGHDMMFTRGREIKEKQFSCNAGVWFAKNTRWTRKFLESVYDLPNGCQEVIQFRLWEQGMIVAMLKHNSLNCRKHIFLEDDRRAFNSPRDMYQDGDFLLHFIAVTGKEAIKETLQTLQEHMERYYPQILRYSTTSNPE